MNTTPENLDRALVAEPPSREGLDENSVERIHLTLEDGLGYRCSFVKRADESLDSLITAYQVYSGLARTSINLSNRGLLLDPNVLLLVQHIFNGDKLDVVINPAEAFDLRSPLLTSKLLSLSPKNDLGFSYDDPYGPPTQPSERQATVILNDVWPGMAPLAITIRSLREHDANHIVQVIQEGLLGNARLLSITTSPMATQEALLIMTEAAKKEHPLSTSISSIAAGVELEQVITLDIIPTDGQGKDTSDKMTLLAGQHTLMGDVKTWINERLSPHGQSLLFHEQSVLHDENDLSDEGFWPGHTYTLRLFPAKQPAWLHPPRLNHGPVPHRVPLIIRLPNREGKGVIVRREDTLLHALEMAGIEHPETLRPSFEGLRFALTDTAAHIYRVSKGHGVDIEQEQVGGSGPRLRSSRDEGCQTISQNQPLTPASQQFNRLTQESVLGCIRGQYTNLPRAHEDDIRLQLRGVLGPWAIVLSRHERICYALKLIASLVQQSLRFSLDGDRVDFAATPAQLDLEDGDLIDVFLERSGGGLLDDVAKGISLPATPAPVPSQTPSVLGLLCSKVAFMGSLPDGYLLLKIVTEDGKTWHSVHHLDAPLDETTSFINLSHGGKLRYLLDGERLLPQYSPRYMGIEHGDIIEAFAEQFGGGDPGGAHLPGLLDGEDEEERYSETRFDANEEAPVREAHPTILADTRPAATFTKFGIHEHEGGHLPTSVVGTSGVTRSAPSPPAARDKSKLHPSELAGFQELLRPYHPPGRGQRDLTKLLPPVDPKTGNVQKWAGRGSRQFIRRYEQLGRVCEATPEDLIEMLSLNVLDESPDIYSLITSSPEFETRNWEDIKWFILTSFDGPPGEKYTAVDLEAFIKKDRTISTVAEIIDYTLQYKEIADTLLRHNLITSALHVRYYVQGLPKTVRQELRHIRLDSVNPTFAQVEAAVRTHFMPSDFFARVTQDIDRTEAQRNNSALIKGPSVRVSGSSRPATSDQVIAQSIERFGTRVERVMQAVETGLKSLGTASSAPGFIPAQPSGRSGPSSGSPATGPNSVPLGGAPPARSDTCAYCNDSNHYKNKCPLLNEQMALGNVILHEGRVCWQDFSLVPGKWGAIHAVVQEHLRNGTIPRSGSGQPVQSNILMLSTMTHELHPSGGTYENGIPVGFEAFPAQRQNVGGDRNLRSRPYQPPAPPAQGTAPAGHPPGSMAPGIQAPQPPPRTAVQPAPPPNNPVQGSSSDASPAAPGAPADQDEAMDADWQDKPSDPPAVRKLKAAFRSRASHLDRHADPDTMAETIMDLEISVTVRQILSLSKPVQKIFLNWLRGELLPIPIVGKGPWKSTDEWRREEEEAARQDGTAEVQVALSLIEALNRRQSPTHVADRIQHQLNNVSLRATPSDPWYSRSLPSTTVTIGRYAILALIDCGSQVNIMREDLLEALMLPLRTDRPQVIIGAAEQESSCAGLSECVATTLAGHTKPLHYFVQSACSYPIILGMSALSEFGIVLDCATGNITMATPDGKQLKIKVVDLDDAANRQVMTTTLRPQVHHQALKLIEGGAWTDRPTPHHVNAKQKAVKDKVNPSDQPPSSFFKEVVLGPVPLGRDPYKTPLTPHPPAFHLDEYWTQERVDGLDLGPAGFVNEQERDLLMRALDLHKSCLAWDLSDLKVLRPEISTGFHVNVVPHKIFQDQTYPYPKAKHDAIKKTLSAYLRLGILEISFSPYITSHFFIDKRDGSKRLIWNCESANKITTPCAYPPPLLSDYIDGFVGREAYSLFDMMHFFHQLPLDVPSRRLFAIRTLYGLLQPTRIVAGGTTSPAVAQAVMDHVGGEDVPDTFCPFVDDGGHKGPRSNYNDELLPGTNIRRWVWEFAVSFERVLYRLESAGLVINGRKMVVITNELDITGVKVSKHGKRADPSKVATLKNWPNPPPNQTSLRAFLGLANYLRAFIPDFARLDGPLRAIVGKRWDWTPEASEAMDNLKQALSNERYLGVIDYSSNDEIILSVDSSQTAAGFVLYQVRNGERVLILFDSVGFTDVEQRYGQPKLELCGVYKAFRRLRYYLTGCRFTLEVDAISLAQMINKPDVTNSTMLRWIANMKMHDFTVRHVPGKLHVLPDGLSRTSFNNVQPTNDWPDDAPHFSVNTSAVKPPPVSQPRNTATMLNFNEAAYEGRWRLLGLWLSTGGGHVELGSLARADRKWLRARLAGFFLEDGRLWKRTSQGLALLVIGKKDEQDRALHHGHEQHGHRGRDALVNLLLKRVWWETIRSDCHSHVQSCKACQLRSTTKEAEPQRAAPIPTLFEAFALDIVDLGANTGPLRYLVLARCLLTGWVEGRALPNKLASSVAKFIEDDILSRYGPIVRLILTDNGPENLGETEQLLRRLGLRHARITPNHPQGNAVVERGHRPIVEGLLKTAFDDRQRTALYLPQVLWADRITAKRTTGASPFSLVFGHEPLLPIDHDLRTMPMMSWEVVNSTSELLAARARLLRRRDDELARAALLLEYARSQGRAYTDTINADKLRSPLPPGTMVIVASAATVISKSQDRWMGPYLVHSQLDSGSYMLSELDGTVISKAYGSDRLRRYHPRASTPSADRSFLDGAADGWTIPSLVAPARHGELVYSSATMENDLPVPPASIDSDLAALDMLPMHDTHE